MISAPDRREALAHERETSQRPLLYLAGEIYSWKWATGDVDEYDLRA